MNAQSPIVSEFATPEEAEAYHAWLTAKVAHSLADERPLVSHEEAMRQMRLMIDAAARKTEC